MKYRPEIDGLRAIAVLPVIFFHAGISIFSGGYVGVDIFFVISGYLISTIIIRELDKNAFSLINFYERRARRILPALFIVSMFAAITAYFWFAPTDFKNFGKSLFGVSIFSSNIFFWRESGYFDHAAEFKPLLHTWSLAVEEQFYIFFPLLLMLFWRFKIKIVTVILALIFLTSLGLSHWTSLAKPSFGFFILLTRAWELLAGVFAALYLRHFGIPKNSMFSQLLAALGLFFIIVSILTFDQYTPFPSFYALMPVMGTVFIIIWAIPNGLTHKILSLKVFVWVGLISYSAYLWHQPLFAFARYKSETPPIHLMLSLSFLSIILAYISWRWVEQPFRNKTRFSRKKIFQLSGITTFTMMIMGAVIWINNGFINRYDEDVRLVLKNFQAPSEYTVARHNSLLLKEFNPNSERNILIIGDSFSQDLTNALFEVQGQNIENNKISVSTYYIPIRCGVLFVTQEKLPERDPKQDYACRQAPNFFNSNTLLKRMKEADSVWITSAWKSWQLEFMGESIENIKKHNSNITVFGSKNFGNVKESHFVNIRDHSILKTNNPMRDSHIRVNSAMSQEIPRHARFINVSALVCKNKTDCKNYVNGNILSYDGGHLTPHGAKYIGQKIFSKGELY